MLGCHSDHPLDPFRVRRGGGAKHELAWTGCVASPHAATRDDAGKATATTRARHRAAGKKDSRNRIAGRQFAPERANGPAQPSSSDRLRAADRTRNPPSTVWLGPERPNQPDGGLRAGMLPTPPKAAEPGASPPLGDARSSVVDLRAGLLRPIARLAVFFSRRRRIAGRDQRGEAPLWTPPTRRPRKPLTTLCHRQ